jgi:hypothetical protein
LLSSPLAHREAYDDFESSLNVLLLLQTPLTCLATFRMGEQEKASTSWQMSMQPEACSSPAPFLRI